ncbi:hypothetical protein HK104_000440, partial [Borealophlyctis nickersoniae]
MAYNIRRQQLMIGHNRKVRIFQIVNNEDGHAVTEVLERRSVTCGEHTDVVSCIVSAEGRFYSAGYDRKIVIYDIPHHGDLKLRVSHTVTNAHDAAISCMVYGKDADNSCDTITSLCYVLPTQTLWITASSGSPIVYDPRSGINVSDFVPTDDARLHHFTTGGFTFKHLTFIPETNEVIDVVECLTFTSKEPLLIFSGGDDGLIKKWERLQLNTFMYSQEPLILPKEEKHDKEVMLNTFSRDPTERRKKQAAMHKRISAKLDQWKRFLDDGSGSNGAGGAGGGGEEQLALLSGDAARALKRKQMMVEPKKTYEEETRAAGMAMASKAGRTGVVSLLYYEELDLLVSGYEDSKIHVWGYNEDTVKFLPDDADMKDKELLDPTGLANDSVTNRVAGMTLKFTLQDHKDAVTAIVCFYRDGAHWLVSTGWDRRICIWDLKSAKLHDVFRGSPQIASTTTGSTIIASSSSNWKEELAADGIIVDMEYCAERNEVAYASSDKLAYVRKFSPKGDEMVLVAVLQGHEAEVTKIKWNQRYQQWITGSEDRTIRIWPADGIPCLRIINNEGPVTALCIDIANGCIVTGSQDRIIRVFDPEKKDEVVQKNLGHGDEVRSIIHIPARNQ